MHAHHLRWSHALFFFWCFVWVGGWCSQRSSAQVVRNADPPAAFGRLLDGLGWRTPVPADVGGDQDNDLDDSDDAAALATQTPAVRSRSASEASNPSWVLPYYEDSNVEVFFHALPVLAASGVAAPKLEVGLGRCVLLYCP